MKALLPQFRAELPTSVHMDVLYDRSDTIRESYRDVQFTMALTLALVIMVIFVFLRNVWATVIPSLALPFSIIGTFAVMYMLGYSLDNLSMMALILSVGFVVDDAIVMLENIYRHVEMGEDPLTASLVGSREIGFTIVSMTLSLAAVFIPVLFMGGVLGRLFREFSVTICVAILISGVVSVTLTPMLCSRFLKKPKHHGDGATGHASGGSRFAAATERDFEALLNGYDRTLQIVLRHRGATMVASGVVLVLTAVLFVVVPKGFIPDQDTDQLAVTTEAAQGTSYDKLVEYQDAGRRHHPRRSERRGARVDDRRQRGQHARRPEPRPDRRAPQAAQRAEGAGERRSSRSCGPQLADVAGMQVFLQNPPTIRIGGQVSKSLYQFSMQSPDRDALYAASRTLLKALGDVDGLDDLTSDLEVTSPQVNVDIDRDKAAALGVTANAIENAFYDAYGPRWVSTIYAPVNEYKVLLELAPQFQADPAALSLLYFKATPPQGAAAAISAATQRPRPAAPRGAAAAAGIVVPLDTLAHATQVIGPQTVNHYGQLPAVTISFGLAPGASLGDVLSARARRSPPRTLPDGVSGQFQGAAKAFQSSLVESRRAARHRHHGRLHRARHPVRELHPPADDSLRPAVGRLRRAAHAHHLPDGSEHLRVRRHDHADRHRREERDHADRLRARSRAPGQHARAGDLPGLPDPLPADHDDDDGGAARRGADRARLRRGRRGAAAARPGRRRRAALLAARDAVSDAGRLHLHGAGAGVAEEPPARVGACSLPWSPSSRTASAAPAIQR